MASRRRDYYEVLGVPRDADGRTIKSAFRALALRLHPDRNPDPDAEQRFHEIAEAYAVLSDPEKRASYDSHGFAGVSGFSSEDLFGGIDLADLFGGLGFDFGAGEAGPLGGLGSFFGRSARRAGARSGATLRVALEVDLETVASGGSERVRIGVPHACAACSGTGARAGTEPRRCDDCGGRGQQVSVREQGNVRMQQIRSCPRCEGRGHFVDDPCGACGGRGEVAGDETLQVHVPAGIEDGAVLRIPGKGLPSPSPGGSPGDLHVIVRSRPDPRFARRGADLWHEASIELPDAVLGCEIEVPTLDGQVLVTVPAGSRSGAVLRVHGKGLPRFRGEGRGDLYLQIHLHVPGEVGAEERALWEQLRALGRRGAR